MISKKRIYCRACEREKMLFSTAEEARKFIKYNADEIRKENGKAPTRVYFCPLCQGYHLTSKDNSLYYTLRNRMLQDKVDSYGEKYNKIVTIKDIQKTVKELEDNIYQMYIPGIFSVADKLERQIERSKDLVDESIRQLGVKSKNDAIKFMASEKFMSLLEMDEPNMEDHLRECNNLLINHVSDLQPADREVCEDVRRILFRKIFDTKKGELEYLLHLEEVEESERILNEVIADCDRFSFKYDEGGEFDLQDVKKHLVKLQLKANELPRIISYIQNNQDILNQQGFRNFSK